MLPSNPATRKPAVALDGVLLLDKPQGMSSNQAVQRVKRLLCAAKVGHTGSLDPLATGMLPLCFGEATKFAQRWLDADKTYVVTMVLGTVSTTLDAEGELSPGGGVSPLDTDALDALLRHFSGTQWQVPPMYSALKQQGVPLYELARQGIEVERKPRSIRIKQLELIHYDVTSLTLKVRCSKGTYIRTLVDDMGRYLGCGAYVQQLRRLQVGDWTAMYSVDRISEAVQHAALAEVMLPVEVLVKECRRLDLNESVARHFRLGQSVWVDDSGAGELCSVFVQNVFIGLGEIQPQQQLKPVRLMASAER